MQRVMMESAEAGGVGVSLVVQLPQLCDLKTYKPRLIICPPPIITNYTLVVYPSTAHVSAEWACGLNSPSPESKPMRLCEIGNSWSPSADWALGWCNLGLPLVGHISPTAPDPT